jgi:hypothetical protein
MTRRMPDRLIDIPPTLTDRQQTALEIVRAHRTITALELGRILHGHYGYCQYCKPAGMSVLTELASEKNGRQVKRVWRTNRWTLREGGARTASDGAAVPPSSPSAQGDLPEDF